MMKLTTDNLSYWRTSSNIYFSKVQIIIKKFLMWHFCVYRSIYAKETDTCLLFLQR
uniref:Uncharacterized protein n=1 Tax=Rhizophora mucronata TaxID=61149 RepID=A0A2P2NU50_RHIMU